MVYDGSNYIYIVGGYTNDGTFSASNRFERYSVKTNTWEVLSPLPLHMYSTKAFYYNGNIVVLAGNSPDSGAYTEFTGGAVLNYNIASATWSPLQPIAHDLTAGTAAFDGQRYIYATSNPNAGFMTLRYDVQQNNWITLPPAPQQVIYAMGIIDGQGRFYLFGGFNPTMGYVGTVQRYDPSSNTWTLLNNAPVSLTSGTATYDDNGHVYISPGETAVDLKSYYKYDINSDSWQQIQDQPTNTNGNSAVWDGSGVIMTGGFDGLNNDIMTNSLYRFEANPPVVGPVTAPASPQLINTTVSVSGVFTDLDLLDTHTASWNWGDGNTSTGTISEINGSGSVSDNHVYTQAGVYVITLTVTDNHGFSGSNVFQYLSVYNPTPQGLFSGARIFTSPAGAYPQNTGLTGKVMFGVSVKYNNNNQPTGNVSMDFKDANLSFVATLINSLVTSNGMATVTGSGTVNGSGNYTFLATGIDSNVPGGPAIRFQIKDLSNTVIYDSQIGAPETVTPTASVTGQVVVH